MPLARGARLNYDGVLPGAAAPGAAAGPDLGVTDASRATSSGATVYGNTNNSLSLRNASGLQLNVSGHVSDVTTRACVTFPIQASGVLVIPANDAVVGAVYEVEVWATGRRDRRSRPPNGRLTWAP
jgi:hypothetical protein